MKVRKGFHWAAFVFGMLAIMWYVVTAMIACYNMPYNIVMLKYIPWHSWVSCGIGVILYIIVRVVDVK